MCMTREHGLVGEEGVGEKKNKSDVIIPMLRRAREEMHVGGRSVFFFDDDIREVLDDDLSKETSLLRILFVSTSWVHPDPSLL